MKILITGGAGFIGSNLTRKLAAQNADITVLDTLSPQIHGDDPYNKSALFLSLPPGVRFIQGSVTDRPTLERAMQGQEAIVHLAAETGTGQSMYEVDRYVDVNIRGTGLMLDILVQNDRNTVRKVVVASSRAIYGEGKYYRLRPALYIPARALRKTCWQVASTIFARNVASQWSVCQPMKNPRFTRRLCTASPSRIRSRW